MRTCVRVVRQAPRPLRLLLPRRGEPAFRAGGGGGWGGPGGAAVDVGPARGGQCGRAPPPPARHVTLLVRDARGWSNLCRLLTKVHAHTRAPHGGPVVDAPRVTLRDVE